MSKFLPSSGGPPKPRPRPVQPQPVHPESNYEPYVDPRTPRNLPPNAILILIIAILAGMLIGFVARDVASWIRFDPAPIPRPEPRPEPRPIGELRVILVSDLAKDMTKGQLDVLSSTAVRAYLNAHCGKDADGRPAWRSWPIDVDPKGESETWQKAWEATKATLGPLPQVVIFRGNKGEALPMPDSEDGLLDLLKKHGG